MVNTRGTGVRSCSRLFLHDKIVNHCQWLTQQWSNRGEQGAECPQRLLTGKFLLTYREKIGKKKKGGERGKNWEEKKENCKGNLKIGNGSRKSSKKRWGLFFFFFSFFFFFFFFAFHFWKRRKFVLGLPKWEKAFHVWKKSEKMTLPLRKICLLCPWGDPGGDPGDWPHDWQKISLLWWEESLPFSIPPATVQVLVGLSH